MAAPKTAAPALPDSYLALVKQFPLTPIRDEARLDVAQERIDRLLGEHRDAGGQAYLDALTDLVETYEDQRHALPDVSAADVLRYLMETRRLTQAQLAKRARLAPATVAAVLSGTRSLTKEQIRTLANFFHVSPAAFLSAR